jgi:hypothetical protein
MLYAAERVSSTVDSTSKEAAMRFRVPTSIKDEHDELHAELVTATKAGGRTGEAARTVARLLHPHFVKEEEYALPPLGLLSDLARGVVAPEMLEVLAMTDKLKGDLRSMLEEHQAIVGALEALASAATAEDYPETAEFARRLMHHATLEEQVMYPAALLVGEYLRRRFESRAP